MPIPLAVARILLLKPPVKPSQTKTKMALALTLRRVSAEQLQVSIDSRLSSELSQQFQQALEKQLKQVIAHTQRQTRCPLTPSDLACIIPQSYLDSLQAHHDIQNVFLANSLQQGFIYHALKQGDIDDAYVIQLQWHYHQAINPAMLKQAWSQAQTNFATLAYVLPGSPAWLSSRRNR